MSRRPLGFTLVETLSVIAIIAVLVAILVPVIVEAKNAARRTTGIANFKQLYLAFSMYRTDYNGDAVYGKASSMGLPDHWHFYQRQGYLAVSDNEDLWQSPCGVHPEFAGQTDPKYVYYPSNLRTMQWEDYVLTHGDNTVFLVDKNCVDHSVPIEAQYFIKPLIGLRLNGQATLKRVRGETISLAIWN